MQINFSIDNFSVEGNSFFNKCKRKQEIKLEFFLHHVEKDTDTPIHYIICTKRIENCMQIIILGVFLKLSKKS